ncbi:SLAP domain-containing protein [Lactobacillus crispatus]|uniref:SLAP domain-containing protein n=2 Tax=Lactobacillus crispatus TaxID=47770 RepID=UPI002A211794|nr:SLAP domain-containing protein [Lactobacillus crispatus]
MKKNVLVSLSVATLLSVGAVGVNEVNGVANNTNVVQAAVKNGKLTHNAYIYKSNGNRYGKKVLKKGKTVKILGTKKIYGKKYYRIGKNQYVKVANFAKKTSKANTASGQYYLTHNAYVYNAEGKRIKGTDTLKKNHVFTVVGVKTINGKNYLSLGNGQYVKATNAQSTSAEGANNPVNNNATDTAVGNTTGNSATAEKKTNNYNSSNSQSKKQEWIKEKGYIYFTDDQVSQIQNYLWQKINAYRQSKGYPAYKTNPELNNFVNRIMQKGTPEYNALGDGIGTFQNTDTLAKFLPKLKALGMDSARSLNDLDAFRYNNVKQHFINLKERDPKKVADEIFNAYTREEDNIDLRTLEGHKDKYAYAALKVRFNNEGDYIDHGLELNFTVVGSYSPEWIKAWEAAK